MFFISAPISLNLIKFHCFSGNSVPQLVRPSASPLPPSIHYPEHSVPHLEHPGDIFLSKFMTGSSLTNSLELASDHLHIFHITCLIEKTKLDFLFINELIHMHTKCVS